MSTEHVTAVEIAVKKALRAAEDSTDIRTATRLAACLVRLIDRRTAREIHDAFGAPGDWGYETPIGEALYALYSSASKASP